MARNITLTLGAGLGADLGPNFNLTANAGSVTPSTATKTELTAGKIVSVDDTASTVTVTSTGTCTNAITQTIPCASYSWLFHGGGAGFSTSAAALASSSGGPTYYSNSNAMIGNVTTFYTDTARTTLFNGGNLWYRVQLNALGTNYAAFINSSGLVTTYTT
jgi:hypothetical protein